MNSIVDLASVEEQEPTIHASSVVVYLGEMRAIIIEKEVMKSKRTSLYCSMSKSII